MRPQKLRILCIDGGGVRGAAATAFLAKLEQASGKQVTEMFDYFAGTSVGGMITLYCGGLGGSAAAAADLFNQDRLGKLMHRSLFDRLLPSLSILSTSPKYDGVGKRDVLREVFGQARLAEAKKPVLITAYDLVARRIAVFKSTGGEDSLGNPTMAEIGDATSAAPSYYPPVKVQGVLPRWMCDGGVAANNPAMCALSEALKLGYEAKDIQLISIGTGYPAPDPSEAQTIGPEATHWGTVSWLKHGLIDHLIDGSASAVSYWTNKILGSEHYLRVTGPLNGASSEMDDTDPSNMAALRKLGESWFDQYGAEVLKRLGEPNLVQKPTARAAPALKEMSM